MCAMHGTIFGELYSQWHPAVAVNNFMCKFRCKYLSHILWNEGNYILLQCHIYSEECFFRKIPMVRKIFQRNYTHNVWILSMFSMLKNHSPWTEPNDTLSSTTPKLCKRHHIVRPKIRSTRMLKWLQNENKQINAIERVRMKTREKTREMNVIWTFARKTVRSHNNVQ